LAQDNSEDRRQGLCKLHDLKQMEFLDTTGSSEKYTPTGSHSGRIVAYSDKARMPLLSMALRVGSFRVPRDTFPIHFWMG